MRRAFQFTLMLATAATVAGCVATDLQRAAGGAAIGAVGAAVVSGSVGTGILVGAAAGALCDDVGVCN